MSIAPTEAPDLTTQLAPPAPRPHGLLSVMETVAVPGEHWIYGGIDLEQVCDTVGVTTAFCVPEGGVPDKTPFTGEWAHLDPVAAYALYECSAIGQPVSERADHAQRALAAGVQTALEAHLESSLTPDAATAPSLLDALVDAEDTPGFDEGRVIHVSPGTAVRLDEYLHYRDGRLVTVNGTPVVSGLGYSPDTLLLTGRVAGTSGGVYTSETVIDRPTNLVSVLAEQPWALGVTCGAVKYTLTV